MDILWVNPQPLQELTSIELYLPVIILGLIMVGAIVWANYLFKG